MTSEQRWIFGVRIDRGGGSGMAGDPVSGRCVCGHGKFLHRKGVCFASVNPCGCTSYETPSQADKPCGAVKHTTYKGQYDRSYTV